MLFGSAPHEELVLQRMPLLKELQIGLRTDRDDNAVRLKIQHLPTLERLNPSVYRKRENPQLARWDNLELIDLPRLSSVYLTAEELGSSGLLSLGRLPALESLELFGMTIPGETFHWLAGLDQLTYLNCQTNDGDRALKALSNIKTLTHLKIRADEVSDSGLKSVSELSKLEVLTIAGIKDSHDLSTHLSKLTNLEELFLSAGVVPEITFADHPSLEWIRLNLMETDKISVNSLPQLSRIELGYGNQKEISLINLPKLAWCEIRSLEPERIESIHLADLPGLTHFSLGPIARNGSIETPTPPFALGDDFLKQFVTIVATEIVMVAQRPRHR